MAKTDPIKFTGAMVKKYGQFFVEHFVKTELEIMDYDHISLELDHSILAFKDGSAYHLTDFDCIKANELGNEEYAAEIERKYAKYMTMFCKRKYETAQKLYRLKKKLGLVKPLEVKETKQKEEKESENAFNK